MTDPLFLPIKVILFFVFPEKMKVHFVATIFLIIALTQVEAIAKGRNVTIQEIPWLVMIKSNDQIYSGVLVEENLVLTLATICNKTV